MHSINNLFIVGNGFDIWTELNTRYSDFEKYYEENKIRIFKELVITLCELRDKGGNLVEELTQFDLLYFVLSEHYPTARGDDTVFGTILKIR